MRTTWMVMLGLVGLAAAASAQEVTTFADLPLRLNLGDEVGVEDRSGVVTWGRLERLGPDEIAVAATPGAERVFPGASVRRVQKRGDSVWNGIRWGTVIGGAVGCVFAAGFAEQWRFEDCPAGILLFAPVGAGLGLAVDAMRSGATTVFSAPDDRAGRQRPFAGGVVARVTWSW